MMVFKVANDLFFLRYLDELSFVYGLGCDSVRVASMYASVAHQAGSGFRRLQDLKTERAR